jgi:hypothetical protein
MSLTGILKPLKHDDKLEPWRGLRFDVSWGGGSDRYFVNCRPRATFRRFTYGQ